MSTTVSTRTPGSLNPTRQQLDDLDALLKRMLDLPVSQLDDPKGSEDVGEEPSSAPPVQASPRLTPMGRPIETKPAASPVSYMVVETASPRPLPPASGFEPRPADLSMRLSPVTPAEEGFEEEDSASAPAEQAPPARSQSAEDEVWVPLRSTWQPSAQTWQPLAESWQQANGTVPIPTTISIPGPKLEDPRTREIVPPLVAPDAPPVESVQRTAPVAAPQVPADVTPAEPHLTLSAEDAPVPVSRLLLLPLVWFNQGFDACLAPLGAPGRWLSRHAGRQTLGVLGVLCLAAATAIAVSARMGWTW